MNAIDYIRERYGQPRPTPAKAMPEEIQRALKTLEALKKYAAPLPRTKQTRSRKVDGSLPQ